MTDMLPVSGYSAYRHVKMNSSLLGANTCAEFIWSKLCISMIKQDFRHIQTRDSSSINLVENTILGEHGALLYYSKGLFFLL